MNPRSSFARPPALQLAVQYGSSRASPARGPLRRWVATALRAANEAATRAPVAAAALTIRFVDEDEGRTLNRTFRGKDSATNVLTFPLTDDDADDDAVEADIVVCMPVVEREAREQAKDPLAHCAHLVVHGVLHAVGLDHETQEDAGAMEAIERAVLARFRIADPYVVR